MGIGDKLTWAYRTLFILMLVWLRYVEESVDAWGIVVVWAVFLYFIFFRPSWAYRLIVMLMLVWVELFESVITIWGVRAIWAAAFFFVIVYPLAKLLTESMDNGQLNTGGQAPGG